MRPTTAPKVRSFEGDSTIIRSAFAQFPSGVAVLAAHLDDAPHSLVASSFMVGVSLDPCLVSVAVQKSSETWQQIKHAGALGVSILGQGQGTLTRRLASKNREARFDEVSVEVDESGAIFIEEAALWLECSIHDVSPAGDHWMVLLEVERLGMGGREPLIWHAARFRQLADAASVDVA